MQCAKIPVGFFTSTTQNRLRYDTGNHSSNPSKTIKNLDVSKEFKAMAKANGFKTLQDILDMPLHELPYKPHSGYRMLKEFLDIVEMNGLDYLVEEN